MELQEKKVIYDTNFSITKSSDNTLKINDTSDVATNKNYHAVGNLKEDENYIFDTIYKPMYCTPSYDGCETCVDDCVNCQDKQTLLRGNKNITLMDLAGGSLWNKWVKAECWKGVYDYLKSLGYENIRPNGSEDCFFSFYALKYCRNLLYVFKEVYYYHNERSSVFNDENYVKYENFLRFRAYHKEITDAIKKLNMGIITDNFLKADICCHTQKALSCIELKKALDNVAEEFGKEAIIKNLIMGQYYYLKHPYVKYLAYKYLTRS